MDVSGSNKEEKEPASVEVRAWSDILATAESLLDLFGPLS